MSAGGFKAEAGLAERDISIGDGFGRSVTSSKRGFSNLRGGVDPFESLEGEELSVVIRSLSRKRVAASLSFMSVVSSSSLPPHLSFPFEPRGDGMVKVFERGELTRPSPSSQL